MKIIFNRKEIRWEQRDKDGRLLWIIGEKELLSLILKELKKK